MEYPIILFIFDSPTQIIFVVGILVLLFGAGRLPQLAKSIGQSRKAFKDALRESEEEEAVESAKITSGPAPANVPRVAEMSDQALEEELRRRAEARAEH